MILSELSSTLIANVREAEATRVLTPDESLNICGHEGELEVSEMTDEQMLQYVIFIVHDIGQRVIKERDDDRKVAALRKSLDDFNRKGKRRV